MTNPVTITLVNVGTAPNDGLGDPIRTAFTKCNDNFTALNVFGNNIINGTSSVSIPSANGNVNVSVANIANVAVFTSTGLRVANAINSATITTSGVLNVGAGATIGGDLIVYGNITGPGNINVISGNSGQFFGNSTTGFSALYAGLFAGYANVPQTILQLAANYNGYAQVENQNINPGAASTTDYIATADNGSDNTFYVDLGVASSTYAGSGNNALGTSLLPNDSFLYAQGNTSATPGGNLVIGTTTVARVVKIIAGGGNSQNIVATFNAPNTVSGSPTTGALTIIGGLGVTGDINANAVAAITVAGTLTTAAQPNITSVGTLASLNVLGNITAGNIVANVSGTVTNAINVTGAAQPNITSVGTLTSLSTSGTITAATINAATIGNAGAVINAATVNAGQIGNSGSLLTGTLTTAAQPNITSVGTLSSLNVLGNITAGNIIANVSGTITNAINVTGAAQPNITSVGTLSSLSVTGGVSAASFTGNGAGLTGTASGLTAGNITGQSNSATITAATAATPSTIALRDGAGSLTATNFYGQASTALYADLAENYLADEAYAPGTVLSYGGVNEVTISLTDADPLVAGVVSTKPAYLMNSGLHGKTVSPIVFSGRVPCRVQGPITRGAMLVSDGNGRARAEANPLIGTVIGKALESFDGELGVIEIVVGKV